VSEYLVYGSSSSPAGAYDYTIATSSTTSLASGQPYGGPGTIFSAYQNGVVANDTVYYPNTSGSVVAINITAGTYSTFSLPSGTAGLVTIYNGVIYILGTGASPPLYSYNASTSTLTLLLSSVTAATGAGSCFACDGVNVYTDNSAGKIYKTLISSGASTNYSYGSTTYAVSTMAIDPTDTNLYIGVGYPSFGGLGKLLCLTTSLSLVATDTGGPGGVAKPVTGLSFDPSGNLWAVNYTYIGYYTSPSSFGGLTSASLVNGGTYLAMDGSGNAYVGVDALGKSAVDKYAASSLTQTNIFNNHATGTTLPYPQYFLCYDKPATAQQQIVMII